ncbi:MAG: ribosome silencing factor [Treponema sp.]|jgi:ribosome-associated protein|nr:ribosome silencing factor [Treponema sp.]
MDELLPETARAHEEPGFPPGEEAVRAICRLLEDHKGADVTALDLRRLHIWTDFFVIATVTSGAHLQGLLRHLKDFAAERGMVILGQNRRADLEDGWNLVDMGTAVIHLMSAPARVFYELEQLWSGAALIYSSKSS